MKQLTLKQSYIKYRKDLCSDYLEKWFFGGGIVSEMAGDLDLDTFKENHMDEAIEFTNEKLEDVAYIYDIMDRFEKDGVWPEFIKNFKANKKIFSKYKNNLDGSPDDEVQQEDYVLNYLNHADIKNIVKGK